MFDSHIHLNDNNLYKNIDKYIFEACSEGVSNFLVIGYDLESSKKAIEIASNYECCYAAIGFHPCDVYKLENSEILQAFLDLFILFKDKVVCLGEIGLDYYWEKDECKRANQKKWFIYQLDIARKLNLPVSIHTREATNDTYEILKNYDDLRIVLHCFNASKEMLNLYLKLNTYFSIGGVITFKNATNLNEVVKYIPLERLLIETDAPYLTPVPFRGKLNEPKYIKYTLEHLSKILKMDFIELDRITTDNAIKVFLNGK